MIQKLIYYFFPFKVSYTIQLIVDTETDCNFYISADKEPTPVVKVDIRGNHDSLVQPNPDVVRSICDAVNRYWGDYW